MSARFWWVNHPHTHQWEIDGSYLWFPRRNGKTRGRSESHQNIRRMLPGDTVLSCSASEVGAVGVVFGAAREAVRPPEFASHPESSSRAESDPGATGWLVPVRFMALENVLSLSEHYIELARVLPPKHAPIRANGVPNQTVLLAAVPDAMSKTLRRLLDGQVEYVVSTIREAGGSLLAEDIAEQVIQQRTDIGPAQKALLQKARYGQGLYRENLESVEHACRVTGVLDRRHLRASHIKPWHESDDGDKLNGCNGLLLSPHLAHLFARGYISFTDAGDLLVSRQLNPAVLESWRIPLPHNGGPFNPEQRRFLDFHRREIFQQHGGGRRRESAADFVEDGPTTIAEPAVAYSA